MLTQLEIRNFKRFEEVSIELGNPVVFIGPNNSGKTTALQALALWHLGLRRWLEKRGSSEAPSKRPGVAINRKDFVAAPIPHANLLWRDLHTRDIGVDSGSGKQTTSNVRIDIRVQGVSPDVQWECGLEFDYANEESLYCRPLNIGGARMPIPPAAGDIRVAFLPPMSGLSDREFVKQPGEIAFLIGQGRTAEVLRNLCLQVWREQERWERLTARLRHLFGIELLRPVFIQERGEIALGYKDPSGAKLDLSCSGRGVQQTLLLLSYLAVNPRSVLLLDEPDAHLEILRQRQIYGVLTEAAAEQGSQVIAASHSEVILNEAAGRDVVVAFVGAPHRIDDRGSQAAKALKEIGFEHYYEAEQKGWVLYLEGSTDLAILQAFAAKLGHSVAAKLEDVFVHYVENQPAKARDHFFGLREAKPDLAGFLLLDRADRALQPIDALAERMWARREIENYLCQPATLEAYAASLAQQETAGPLFAASVSEAFQTAIQESIRELVPPLALGDPADPWWRNEKVSETFLDRLFERFFARVKLPNLMRKTNYHRLAAFVRREDIDPEVADVLDHIERQSGKAVPRV